MKLNRLAFWCLLAAALSSCMSAKQMTYFNDMVVNDSYPVKQKPEIVLQPGDIVNISVSSSNPQLAVPFNMIEAVNLDAVILDNNLSGGQNKTVVRGYQIDSHGNIDFPVLGQQHLAGKTLAEVRDFIMDEIVTGGHIKEPIVNVDIKNFEYVIISSGSSESGAQTVDGNSMTLLEALSRRSVLSSSQKLKDIRVIRTEGDQRKVYSVNILKKDFFDSPVFYLRQNDIIYVQPRGGRLTPESQFALSLISTVTSISSFAVTVLLLVQNGGTSN